MKEILTIAETAKFLKCSVSNVHALINRKKLQCYRDGRLVRIDYDQILAYLQSCRTEAPQPAGRPRKGGSVQMAHVAPCASEVIQ